MNCVADQNQHAPNDFTTTRCTYKYVQTDDIRRSALNRRCI